VRHDNTIKDISLIDDPGHVVQQAATNLQYNNIKIKNQFDSIVMIEKPLNLPGSLNQLLIIM